MTILVDISELADLKALVACIDAGEDIVLTRDGRTVATINMAGADVGVLSFDGAHEVVVGSTVIEVHAAIEAAGQAIAPARSIA